MPTTRTAQLGVALAALGIVVTLMGLFPGMTGLQPALGIGIMQIFVILFGVGILIFGAAFYVQITFYRGRKHNLSQQIGLRLAATGFLLANTAGLADVLGFGSHNLGTTEGTLFGLWQAAGILIGFLMAAIGILLFAVMGKPWLPLEETSQTGDMRL